MIAPANFHKYEKKIIMGIIKEGVLTEAGAIIRIIEHTPSLQERRNVNVGSISFLILMRASRTIGPH